MQSGWRHLLCRLAIFLLFFAATAAAQPTAPLSEEDCLKCHEKEINNLQQEGGEHQTLLTCLDCHRGHPPRDLEVIRPCGDCHQGRPHFDRQGPCLICHRDPHRPRQLTLTREGVAACLDCHPGVGDEFSAAPSLHARFACTACHPRHPEAFPCGECHFPHASGAAEQHCQQCHPPHRPRAVAFDQKADSLICVNCHAEVSAKLEQGGRQHRQLGCAVCHAGAHKTIPDCRQCHPDRHPIGILDRFPLCTECHGDPHSPL